jgi:thiamine-phosphate pyrophosphorylase
MALRSSSTRPILCAVLDGAALGPDPKASALALFTAGVDWIQLRDRLLSSQALLQLAQMLVQARDAARANSTDPCVLVNKRVDIVLAAGCDGAHLGFDALDVTTVAALLPENALIGASFHCVDEIQSLAAEMRDQPGRYAHLAPIWDPFSKPASRPALGPDLLAKACGLGLPVIAQGGIDPSRARAAIRAGAAGIAVTGILGQSRNPISSVRQLREALDRKIPSGTSNFA